MTPSRPPVRRRLGFALFLCLVFLSLLPSRVLAFDDVDYAIFDLKDDLEKVAGKDATFYSVLGLPTSAPLEQINRAYKRTALKYHPDKTSNKTEQQIYTVMTSAVETLRDEESRERYDFYLQRGFPTWRGTGYYYSHFKPSATFLAVFIVLMLSITQYLAGYAKYAYDAHHLNDLRALLAKQKPTIPQVKAMIRRQLGVEVDEYANLASLELEDLWFFLNEVNIETISKKAPSVWDVLIVQMPLWAYRFAVDLPTLPARLRARSDEMKRMQTALDAEREERKWEEEEEEREQEELEREKARREEQKQAKKRRKQATREAEQLTKSQQRATATVATQQRPATPPSVKGSGTDEVGKANGTVNESTVWTPAELARIAELLKKFPAGTTGRYVLVACALKRPVDQVSLLAKAMAKDMSLLRRTEDLDIGTLG